MTNLIKTLEELIAIDSNCQISNRKIIECIREKLSSFECKVQSYKKDKLDLYNLVVRVSGKSRSSPLIFLGHTDTVPSGEKWKTNPFKPRVKDGKVYGLGSTDMKEGLACMISAALNLRGTPQNDIYLLFDADEESGGTGGKELAKILSLKNARIVVAEPSDREIVYKQKGCLDMELEFEGVQMHSSRTDYSKNLKNNAIYKAVDFAQKLRAYEQEIEKRTDPELGKATLSIGEIKGGEAPNVVPSQCSLKICRRLLPFESIDSEYKEIRRIAKEVDSKARTKIIFDGGTFNSRTNGSFARVLSSLSNKYLGKTQWGVKPSWTEAAVFSKFGEVFIFGPGQNERCHIPDEYATVEDLELFTKIYRELMQ